MKHRVSPLRILGLFRDDGDLPVHTRTPEAWKELLSPLPPDVSLFLTDVPENSRTPFGKSFVCLSGESELCETVNGIDYHLWPDLFFQVHLGVTEHVLRHVIDRAATFDGPVLDLYCGAGLFSLALAKQGKKVLGVEIHRTATLAAQTSAERSGLSALARFRTGKAEPILRRLRREREEFSAAGLDPPRRGLQTEVIAELGASRLKRLLYVSCSPPTMARDLKILAKLGFRTAWIRPFDMFPQTYHVEVMAALEI